MLFIALIIAWTINEDNEMNIALIILIVAKIIGSDALLFLGALMVLIQSDRYKLIDLIVLIGFISRNKDKIPMILILLPTLLMLYNKGDFFENILDNISQRIMNF